MCRVYRYIPDTKYDDLSLGTQFLQGMQYGVFLYYVLFITCLNRRFLTGALCARRFSHYCANQERTVSQMVGEASA